MRRRWAGVALAILLTACTGKTQTMGGSWAGRPTAPENFRREFQLPVEFKIDGSTSSTESARELWCREGESNPHGREGPRDFESLASSCFAIPAPGDQKRKKGSLATPLPDAES